MLEDRVGNQHEARIVGGYYKLDDGGEEKRSSASIGGDG